MGRPSKKDQALKALADLGISLEDLIGMQEPTIKEVEVVKEVEVIKEVPVSLDIDDNTKIEIITNVDGAVVLKTKGTNLFKKIQGFGNTARIKYSDLEALKGESPKVLTSGIIAINKVVTKGISLEALIEDIGLDHIYFDKNKVSPNDIQRILSDEVSATEFARLLNNSLELVGVVLEASYVLWKSGRFNDNAKMNTIRQVLRQPDLFS